MRLPPEFSRDLEPPLGSDEAPDFQLASDTLYYYAELHADPPVRLTRPNCPQPAMVVRLSVDSVQVRIGPSPSRSLVS